MKSYHFRNDHKFSITPTAETTILSNIDVDDIGGLIEKVIVKIDIQHTFSGDLTITLIAPSGLEILLVDRRGGSGDDFIETVFDDEAANSITTGTPPFNDIFQPTDSLSLLKGTSAKGLWKLSVSDQALQDGGELKKWELQIVTDEQEENVGPFIFRNEITQIIPPNGNNIIESVINVHGLDNTKIDSLCLSMDIDHSYLNDLTIQLIGPDATTVTLLDRVGGAEDNFVKTAFDDNATISINDGSAPFTGVFKPLEPLTAFKNKEVNGSWILRINDHADLDGGALKSWFLSLKSKISPEHTNPFSIEVNFLGGLSTSQRAIFSEAASRWSSVITAGLTPIHTNIGLVQNLVIDAEAIPIDGVNGTLGQAGPTQMRPDSMLPARGIMQFDTADIQQMENNNELLDVIIHEMGHVLGIGTLWSRFGLVTGLNDNANNPEFVGENAMREYSNLKGFASPTPVPVANTGGGGTRGGHWRESVFDTELMTGYDDDGRNALSRLTIASLQDLGYQVSYESADAYILPFTLLSSQKVSSKKQRKCSMLEVPEIEILPVTNLVG